MMPAIHSTVIHERLYQVTVKYYLIEEDGVSLPAANAVIDQPPPGKVGFYFYYFEAGLRVPPLGVFQFSY